jgi:hypothetical protein
MGKDRRSREQLNRQVVYRFVERLDDLVAGSLDGAARWRLSLSFPPA